MAQDLPLDHIGVIYPGKEIFPLSETGESLAMAHNKEKEMVNAITIGTTYEHYKSTPQKPMLYKITGIARHSENLELMVTYMALYDYGEYGQSWVRPLAMFLEDIEINGKKIPRFKRVS